LKALTAAEIEAGVTVETESGIEALSENFLNAEAQAQMQMITQQEQ
jgi:hypothetical protein